MDALTELEEAYAAFADDPDHGEVYATRLRLADRTLDRALGLIEHPWVRQHAESYGEQLKLYYLFLETAKMDELDTETKVPSNEQLKARHKNLITELRGYEST